MEFLLILTIGILIIFTYATYYMWKVNKQFKREIESEF